MTEIIRWSAVETAAAIRAGTVSVAEITQAHLDRVTVCEPGLRAVVDVLGESAMDQARAMDAARPEELPPLWGLPVTMKINVDVAGYPNSNGIPAFNKDPAKEDSPVTANFRKAGAVIIGRTSAPEFSLRFFTSNPIYGRTLNPWDTGLTSGGSSGGASAAVAAGMGVIGHGNDLGGSLRYPAYTCGLATLRPSLGRVPAFNPSAPAERPATLQMMSVQGAIARSIADIRLAMPSLSARDARDPLWNAAPDSGRAHGARLLLLLGGCASAMPPIRSATACIRAWPRRLRSQWRRRARWGTIWLRWPCRWRMRRRRPGASFSMPRPKSRWARRSASTVRPRCRA